jgi:diacylglycerol kinase
MIFLNSLRSFQYAARGIAYAFRHEQNFRIQSVVAVIVLVLAIYLPLKPWELLVIVLMVALVLVMELVNTALELFTDLLKPRLHHYVGVVKDIMAGAVLLTALCAIVVGGIILGPHLVAFLKYGIL